MRQKGASNVIKQFLILILRTLLASILCIILWAISGKVFNLLPAILFFPVLLIYYQQSILWYFVIASDDLFSTLLGILLSVFFIVLYAGNFSLADSIFVKGICIVGILLGIAQTYKSAKLRILGY
jgi:hypothetical protein